MAILKSIVLFVAAGICEISGGYFIWQTLRNQKPWYVGFLGAVILIAYGIIPCLQSTNNFGRIYAAYGGVFIILSLMWGWKFDGLIPDKGDMVGAAICLIGVATILYWPRK